MEDTLYEYDIRTTQNQEFIDINHLIRDAIDKSDLEDGIAIVYCPHTTAGITVNENADLDVVRDMITHLNNVFPVYGDYKHIEGNSHAHLKSSFMGIEKTIIVKDKKPILGTWQSVFFCEFDGPRTRKVFIKLISG
ncbi:secondary thiamine-phosphate synthase enzyme [Natranaerovirga hydrolytica]|uniref:Secondary thiamine-phosphate synthase enzyme n=1 Tax=Natranaerovirga hydrolytica TaxID=680378 RepID=A0A4R1MMA9_9FIRM|nr:secondary thiamine-phosphate synthase enzyme YjbQ [Natranaerovirga hydrolytica]TCK93230.1 secondary thiamine-phosphate synthase enzyme [Natranaerovirga hydrolytica]